MVWNLVADVGGTNMRLAAVSEKGDFRERKNFPTKGGRGLVEVISEFVAHPAGRPNRICVAAAGVVSDGRVTLTNSGMTFCQADLAPLARCENAKILNDFEAAAWSLASVRQDDITVLQGGGVLKQLPRLIVGPGTGLGVGALVWSGGTPAIVSGEGGHVRIAPSSARELKIFEALLDLWPEVRMGQGAAIEAEAIVSGTGLPILYRAISAVDGRDPQTLDGAQIFAAAEAKADQVAVECISLFQKYLAEIAGDLGLVFSALGGVFIVGGVAVSNVWAFEDPAFLAAFNSGGRHSEWRQKLPVYLYENPDFGLIGALNYLRYS